MLLPRAAGEGDRDGEAGVVEGALDRSELAARDPGSAFQAVRDDDANGVRVVTFGCRLNAYESEQVRAQAAADGVTDAVVFNTCAVTAEAVRQARQAIRKARRERPGARLVVTGCAAQIDPGAFAAMPEVDLVLGNAEKAAPGALSSDERVRVADIFETARPLTSPLPVYAGERDTQALAPASNARRDPALSVALSHASGRGEVRAVGELRASARARAYVEIQNGCDHRCTFCIIPFGRGNSRSIAPERVVAEVRGLARGRLRRGGADRRRPDQLGRRSARGAGAGRAGARDPAPGPGAAAPAALVDRRRRDRRRAAGLPGRRTQALPAPAPVAAVGRRPDPEADEAPPFVGRRVGADRRRPPRPAGNGLRRRLHRRLSDRDRRGVREHAGVRRARPGSPGCTSSPTARAPARRPRGCRR